MKRALIVMLVLATVAGIAFAETGVKKRRTPAYEFGRIVISNNSARIGLAPVAFDHWRHRDKFTCRVCHVDIGFAMKAGATQIKAADNMRGFFCGACHNGRLEVGGKTVFAACSTDFSKDEVRSRCERCHASGRNQKNEDEFYTFAAPLPKQRFGNGIDWEKAEEQGLIKPADFLPGVSFKVASLSNQKEFAIGPKVEGIPEIIFSHKQHTIWNGCEVCHPDLFVGIKKGATKYSMMDIFDGKFCGACHITVAFPLTDCTRCHTKPV